MSENDISKKGLTNVYKRNFCPRMSENKIKIFPKIKKSRHKSFEFKILDWHE